MLVAAFQQLALSFLHLAAGSLPEEQMNVVEIIAYNGYPVQQVSVTTEDGYLLTMHRIPYGKNDSRPRRGDRGRPVAFLQHGLLASSADWIMNMPEQSLGFLLADAGFDVWMGNVRGNYYSKGHANGSATDTKKYWQFSWDEMAAYDLPAMIDRALAVTGQPSLYYVGYSQGTMMMFAHLSERPEFAKKIKKCFAFAPVGTVSHVKGTLSYIGRHLLPEIEFFVKEVGEQQFLPSTWLTKLLGKLICGAFHFMNPVCENILFQMVGPNTKQLNQSRLMVYLSHIPAGTSTQNIIHWAQMTVSGRTQKYDWQSAAENIAHYGTAVPPVYNLSRVDVPLHLYYSTGDWVADEQDVENLLSILPKATVVTAHNLTDFNHIDFTWGLRAAEEIYRHVVATMTEHQSNIAY